MTIRNTSTGVTGTARSRTEAIIPAYANGDISAATVTNPKPRARRAASSKDRTVNLREAAEILGMTRRSLGRLMEERPYLLPTLGGPVRKGVAARIPYPTVMETKRTLAQEAKDLRAAERAAAKLARRSS